MSDRALKIIVVIIGIILVFDIVNVFVMGGPSIFSLIFKSGNSAAGAGIASSSVGVNSTPVPDSGTQSAVITASSGTGDSGAIYVPTKATPIPTVRYITEVTPIQTENSAPSLVYVQPTTQVTGGQDDYVGIYSNDLTFLSEDSPSAVAFKVAEPPLVINFSVTPDMVNHQIVVVNGSIQKSSSGPHDVLVNHTYPSEFSWFTVTVYDKQTGQQIAQDGYGKNYDVYPDNTYTLREAGDYLIQFDGENTGVHVDMFLKREGNIV